MLLSKQEYNIVVISEKSRECVQQVKKRHKARDIRSMVAFIRQYGVVRWRWHDVLCDGTPDCR